MGEVCCFRSDVKYTRVITTGTEGLIRRSLSALGENLDPARFWKINRGIVVNVDHIDRIVRDQATGLARRATPGSP